MFYFLASEKSAKQMQMIEDFYQKLTQNKSAVNEPGVYICILYNGKTIHGLARRSAQQWELNIRKPIHYVDVS